MKKIYLYSAFAGLMLTSCANEDLVVKTDPVGEGTTPMTFQMALGNQSRSTALETVTDNFGVWAIKANNDAEFAGLTLNLGKGAGTGNLDPHVVMDDYKVIYDATTERYGSKWTYETVTGQYLKYWDGDYNHTYFFAYTPANDPANPAITLSNGKGEGTGGADVAPYMTFPSVATTTGDNAYMYANAKVVNNNDYVSGTNGPISNPKKVDLTFNRIMSQVKIAIWNAIPGYTVEMEPLTFVGSTTPVGIAAIPADMTPGDPNSWARGKYVTSGDAKVVYTGTGYGTTTLSFSNAATSKENLNFELPGKTDTGVTEIGNTYDTRTYSSTVYNVMPNNTTTGQPTIAMATGDTPANSGLQFVMNFKLKAIDTNEEIHVKGARVYVIPDDYTAWKANTVYTYVFKITRNASGNTNTTNNPTNDPEQPVDALYPIIFDGLTIEDLTNAESTWVVNQNVALTPANLLVTPSSNTPLTATVSYPENTNTKVYWTVDGSNVKVTANATSTDAVTYTNYATSGANIGETTVNINAGAEAGEAKITATNNGISTTCNVLIGTITAADVTLDATTSSDTISPSFSAGTAPVPAGLTFTYTSADVTVATVDTNGSVTAVNPGTPATTTIDVTCTIPGYNSLTKTINVTVN